MHLKFNYPTALKKIIDDEFSRFGIGYDFLGFSEIKINGKPAEEKIRELKKKLSLYGIEIITDHKELLVQKIKDSIIEMIQMGEVKSFYKTSIYLSEKLGLSYGYLTNVFSELTYSTIENFIILQKIELVKNMLTKENYSLTEAAHKLDYCSVAHLSCQFKKIVGLTPTSFQKIMEKRKKHMMTRHHSIGLTSYAY